MGAILGEKTELEREREVNQIKFSEGRFEPFIYVQKVELKRELKSLKMLQRCTPLLNSNPYFFSAVTVLKASFEGIFSVVATVFDDNNKKILTRIHPVNYNDLDVAILQPHSLEKAGCFIC